MQTELETRTLRRVTWRIIPFIMLLYFIAYIDRVNIGFAALTMKQDLGFTASILGFGAGIFFWGYFIFEVPSNIVLHKLGARIWISRVMLTWGVISGAMAFIDGPSSFYVMRFLLGAAEAGFFPGIILYLSVWFPAHHRAGVTALFMAAVPLSTMIGSPLSAALLEMEGMMNLHGWQWMFILEALPAVILSFVVLAYMTDSPENARWLNDDERTWLINTMASENMNKEAGAKHSIIAGITDRRVLVLSLIYFGTSAGLYTLGIWAPQLIKELGVASMTVGFLNAIPPFVSVIAMVFWSRHSDQTGERTWHVVIACMSAAIGLVIAAGTQSIVGLMASLTLVNIGISCAKPPLWSMPTMFLSGSAAATGIATINSIGNLGGFVAPSAIGWLKDLTGSYAGGLYFVAGLLVLSAILTLAMSHPRFKGSLEMKNITEQG